MESSTHHAQHLKSVLAHPGRLHVLHLLRLFVCPPLALAVGLQAADIHRSVDRCDSREEDRNGQLAALASKSLQQLLVLLPGSSGQRRAQEAPKKHVDVSMAILGAQACSMPTVSPVVPQGPAMKDPERGLAPRAQACMGNAIRLAMLASAQATSTKPQLSGATELSAGPQSLHQLLLHCCRHPRSGGDRGRREHPSRRCPPVARQELARTKEKRRQLLAMVSHVLFAIVLVVAMAIVASAVIMIVIIFFSCPWCCYCCCCRCCRRCCFWWWC